MPSKTDVLRVKLVADGAGKVRAEMLGVDDSFKRVEKTSSSLTSKVKSLSGVFGVLSAAAIGGAIKGTLQFADGIDKAAQAAGVGTEFLQELRFAAEQLGVSNKLVDEGFRRFTRRLGEFVNSGGGPAQKAIEQLGISVTDVNGKFRGTEAVFDDFSVAMQGLASDAERSAFAAQIFGDDAGPKLALLLNEGAEGIRNLRDEAQDIGAVLSDELIDNAVEAQDSLSKMGNVLKVQVTSALVQLAPAITAAADGFVTLAKAAREFFNIGLSPIEAYTKQLDVLAKRAEILRTRLESPLSRLFGQRDELESELESINGQMLTLQQAIFDLGLLAEEEPLNDFGASEGAEGAKELNTELTKIQDRLNPLQAKAKQYGEDLATITGSNLGLQQQAELIKKLDEEFAKATGGPKEFKESVKEIEKQVEQTSDGAAEALEQPFKNAAENIQREFGNSFTQIFRHGEARWETFTDLIRDMFARLAGEIAALLVFKPSIISGGIGGLGLFGSTGAGATGGATAAGAGGIGGLLAGGSGLGLGAIAALSAGAGLGGLYAGGGFNSRAGLAGGLLGGGLGGYGGLLLGSSTALGPLGIPLGILAGSLIGSGIGDFFGGGENTTQRFAFSTGRAGQTGVDSPFGTLSIDRERGVNASAILEQLASIDKSLAAALSAEQINRVRDSLAGTGQAFNVSSFDNEPFDVVKTRLVRIIDSVAENTVASGLLNSIGRDPGNIDQLVGEAGRVLELINLFKDEGGELNAAEQALKALNEQFDEMSDLTEQLGFNLEDVEDKRKEALASLVEDFNVSIRDQILAIQDPLEAALEIETRAAQERLDNAKALGADLVEVERLNGIKREEILKRFEPAGGASILDFGSANSSISKFLQSLRTTGAGGLSISDQTANAETLFNELLGASRTDPAARADLASLLPGLVELKREQLGSTSAFFEFTSFLESSLRNLVDQGDTVSTLEDIGDAITAGANATVNTLQNEIGELKSQIVDLQNDILLLLNKPAAA